MNKRQARLVGALVLSTAFLFSTASSCNDTDMVDGKAELSVPGAPGVTCYWLEVETQSGTNGKETGENNYCAPKAEWDRNRVGKQWVDANGKVKS